MDYEKAYKEALERAKNQKKADTPKNRAIDIVFPELRESEDERIRKFLVELVSNDKENNYRGLYEDWKIDFDDVLAWLEKQKEQIPHIDSLQDKPREVIINGHKLVMKDDALTIVEAPEEEAAVKYIEREDERVRKMLLDQMKRWNKMAKENGVGQDVKDSDAAIAYLEKQETKEKYDRMAPIYSDQESFEGALEKAWKFYNDSGSSTVDGCEDNPIELSFAKGFREGFLCKEKQKEQKPTQTNAEKEYIRTIKGIIADFVRDKQPEDVAFYQKIYNWLDGRHIEQKPTEWSEEDEGLIDLAVAAVEDFYDKKNPIRVEIINFLKSLRPSWKPSAGQIEALERAVSWYSDTKQCDTVLYSLLSDLKNYFSLWNNSDNIFG